ncbi:DNA polymerase III subunit chi [Methylocapsa polymorpha]|uniref:DNA polymerase III subunit chi n=1 Tax=Methylocapsa polymorpha TaxID=3080828 RepID=A0ABZ0HQK3_9HYPH|nr:DNA polymerase III subunit chi [Methylocapsa sp. RX1]
MTEIWFYHLQRRRLESVLPGLIEKSLERGWRVVVQAKSEERLDALDQWLWTFSEASFVAHGRARDGDAELQPVYLSTGLENPNGAEVRLFIEGAEIAEALAEPSAAPYARAILLFDGNDEDDLALARAQWKALKEKDLALSYWREDETGRWEKKA